MPDSAFTILVVDDNEVARELLGVDLERNGYRVRTAEDGLAALQLLRHETVDLVLLDVVMPVLSGLDVLKALRQQFSPRRLPVVMATARDASKDMVKAFDLGANDYVTKPLDLPIVRARIQAQLRGREPGGGQPPENGGEVAPGTVLEERFQLQALLGRGHYGSVFRAVDLKLERPVALKVLHTGFLADRTARLRFQREGMSACRLQHPNAVVVLDMSVTGQGLPYLVMELLEGHSLAHELEGAGPMPLPRCAQIALPLCDVLAEAERLQVIHRDIKPQNIYLHRTADGETVKVVDFGLARMVGEAALRQRLTLDNGAPGTPAYMAPERFAESGYDNRVDVYSLGVVLYEMIAGRLPFESRDGNPMALVMMHVTKAPTPLREVVPAVPAAIEAAVMAALTKDPRARPSAAELAAALAPAFAAVLPAADAGRSGGQPTEA